MAMATHKEFRERVIRAAEAVLERDGRVGPLELFEELRCLEPVHVERWRKGHEAYRVLESWIQLGPSKYDRARRAFEEWTRKRNLTALEVPYTRRTPSGIEELQVTSGDPDREKFFRTCYASADLSPSRAAKLEERLQREPDLVVFQTVAQLSTCSECGTELPRGSLLVLEKGQPLCLACAGLDHLVFLPAGDRTLSRRSRKYSELSAVVVRFNRSRRRYERQGLLVTEEALARATEEGRS